MNDLIKYSHHTPGDLFLVKNFAFLSGVHPLFIYYILTHFFSWLCFFFIIIIIIFEVFISRGFYIWVREVNNFHGTNDPPSRCLQCFLKENPVLLFSSYGPHKRSVKTFFLFLVSMTRKLTNKKKISISKSV